MRKLPSARHLGRSQGPQVAEWERELNAVVYEMYRLTGEEITLVEKRMAGG